MRRVCTTKLSIRLRTVFIITIFLFGLVSATTLLLCTSPHTAYASTNTYPTSIAGCRLVSNPGGGSFTCDLKDSTPDKYYDPWNEENRECTSYAAWMLHSVNGFEMPFNDNASGWGTDASNRGYTVNMTPAVGSIYWTQPGTGHVAWVASISPDKSSVTIEDYNHDYKHNWAQYSVSTKSASGYIHFKDAVPPNNTVLEVKKLTDSDGTNEVVWSKNTDVNESWWNSGSNGVQLGNLIHISQGDITSFDVSLYSSGEHDLFTATAHNVWETWWYPGQRLNTTEILANIGNIHKIIKSIGPDGATQRLYVMTDTGFYEYWWNSGSNGIQHDTIMTLANPIDEYKALELDGTQALYVADQNYPYELHWGPGINGIQQTTFSSFTGITSISFSQGSDNKHRLYVGASSGAIWEASWYPNGSINYWYMTGGAPVVSLQKWEDDSEQVMYEATAGGVFEYYWPTNSNRLGSETIVGSLSNVHAFVRSTDPGGVQSVYTATGTNILESWWIPGGLTSIGIFMLSARTFSRSAFLPFSTLLFLLRFLLVQS